MKRLFAFVPVCLALACVLPLLTEAAQAAPPQLPALPDPMAGQPPPPATEHRVWNKVPIPVNLPVGRERLILFPVPVRIGLPPELGTDALTTQIIGGTVYWKALKPFPAQRVQIQAQASGNLYLIDLSASASEQSTALEIVIPEQATTPAAPGLPGQAQVSATPAEPPKPKEQDYATLVRMAAQQLYAPARLRQLPEGVRIAPVGGEATKLLLRGGAVEATPLAAWRSGSLHVTAVRLRNTEAQEAVLNPARLRGNWLAAAFQHAYLAGRGDLRDTSAAYLVSALPYAEALNGR
jgi:integrating conjugative element protein (TIGR03749 family)